jgi:hypothetical protein
MACCAAEKLAKGSAADVPGLLSEPEGEMKKEGEGEAEQQTAASRLSSRDFMESSCILEGALWLSC